MLHWVFNEVEEHILAGAPPDEQTLKLLLPARDTKHRARRLVLNVKIGDGQQRRKYKCDEDGIAQIWFNIRLTPKCKIYVALGSARKGETASSDPVALELVSHLRSTYRFIYMPAARDGGSQRFQEILQNALRKRIEAKALHETVGAPPREYKEVAEAYSRLQKTVTSLASTIWDGVQEALVPGMTRDARVVVNVTQQDLLRFIDSKLHLEISTGPHDSSRVPITELGSGLQSLLELAILETEIADGKAVILGVEELEAFLHPSAQRTVANRVMTNPKFEKLILTTHSPMVVEEAQYGDVILCFNQKFYRPSDALDDTRASINTALLTGHGAEMLFARSVLLVEGEGDRLFFEQIRRRLSAHDPSGRTDLCYVVPVGGKTAFAPWIRLLESYRSAGVIPIDWLVAADGDGSSEVRKAFSDAQVPMKQDIREHLAKISEARGKKDLGAMRSGIVRLNAATKQGAVRLHLLSLDLEEAALGQAGLETIAQVAQALNVSGVMSRNQVLAELGAVAYAKGDKGKKHPWIRGLIGRTVLPTELPTGTLECVARWLLGAMSEKHLASVFNRWGARLPKDHQEIAT